MQDIAAKLAQLTTQIGDRPVTLVAVTKYATVEQMKAAYAAGIRHFGESVVQDALAKMGSLPREMAGDITWHLIGHLQTNKVVKTVGRFDLIHSVDSARLAEKISAANAAAGRIQPILLQVNISGEATKHGFSPAQVKAAMPGLIRLPGITVKGLMTIAPNTPDEEVIRSVFGGLRDLRDELAAEGSVDLPELSMGMTQDFMHALKLGATMVRIGSFLFQTSKG